MYHGGDVCPALGLVNFALNSSREMLLLENSNDSSASGDIEVEAKRSFVDNICDALFTDAKEERKGRLEANWKHFLRILDHKLLADLCDKQQLWRVKGISADLSDAEMR